MNIKTMTIIKHFIYGFVLLIAAIMMFSCNLEDFDLKKLTNKEDIIPEIFAPLAYGTFKVSDLVTATIPDGFQIPTGGIPLDSIKLFKTGTSFRNAAIDSVYLITNFTNDTPCDMEFDLSFIDMSTGLRLGQIFNSGMIPANTKDNRIQFPFGPVDQDNLMNSTSIKLDFKISSPAGNPVLFKAVKKTSFTIRISFYSPVNLRKLTY